MTQSGHRLAADPFWNDVAVWYDPKPRGSHEAARFHQSDWFRRGRVAARGACAAAGDADDRISQEYAKATVATLAMRTVRPISMPAVFSRAPSLLTCR